MPVADPNFFPSWSTTADTSPRLLPLPLLEAGLLRPHEVPASDGPEPNMRTAALPWATALLPLAVDPLVPDATAPKLSDRRRRSLSDYVNGLGIYSTRKPTYDIPIILYNWTTSEYVWPRLDSACQLRRHSCSLFLHYYCAACLRIFVQKDMRIWRSRNGGCIEWDVMSLF